MLNYDKFRARGGSYFAHLFGHFLNLKLYSILKVYYLNPASSVPVGIELRASMTGFV